MSNVVSFKSYLAEAMSNSSTDKAAFLIAKYLKKKTGIVLFRYPGLEAFKNADGAGFGLRFYSSKKNVSLRFNWKSASQAGFVNLASIDYWNGKTPAPFHIKFDQSVSIVKALPLIADALQNNSIELGTIRTMPDDVPLNEDFDYGLLAEAADPTDILNDILDMVTEPSFAKGKVYTKHKSAGMKIFDQLETSYPSLFVKTGTKFAWAGKAKDIEKIRKEQSALLDATGSVEAKVTRGAAKEKYVVSQEINALESDVERLSFEAQLVDLENLVKLTVSGAANALFVSGKGGVGKTHTTEQILGNLGLRDGGGYFKNTGSASAAGIYSLLFRYKDKIIFFDDSDDALGDQEARNLLKAATDTKKIRKLVWNKMGKNVVDPDEMTDEEILDAGLIPRFFEFTGKIIFISNLPLNKLDPDGALRTRAFIINIDPTEVEIYEFMDKIVGKIKLEDGLELDDKARKHVVDLLRKGKSKQSANLRKLSRGLNMSAGAIASGVEVSDADLFRMIETYATPILGFISIGLVTLHALASSFC